MHIEAARVFALRRPLPLLVVVKNVMAEIGRARLVSSLAGGGHSPDTRSITSSRSSPGGSVAKKYFGYKM
jgi:hypothetical protein